MTAAVPERGFRLGRTLDQNERPWPIGWESLEVIDDGHAHEWELVTIPARYPGGRGESVIRCASCHVPRCGHSLDRDPCMERRHHNGLHITLHGSFTPLGGYLTEEKS